LATAQGSANLITAAQQAALNNVNTASPLGNTDFAPYGTGPNGIGPEGYKLSQRLSPQLEPVFGNQTNLAALLAGNGSNLAGLIPGSAQNATDLINRAFGSLGSQIPTGPINTSDLWNYQTGGNVGPIQGNLDFSGVTALPTSASDFSDEVSRAQDAAYNTQARYLDPQFSQARSDLVQRLADQGISPGNDAYSRATGDLGRQENLAYAGARDAAVGAGNEEQARLFGENLASRQQGVGERQTQGNFANTAQQLGYGETAQNAQLGNAARQAAVNERALQWGQPLSALQAATGIGNNTLASAVSNLTTLAPLSGFEWAGSLPTFGGSPTAITPPNVVGAQTAANTAALNRYAAGNQQQNQLFNGLGSLGGALGLGNGGLGSMLGLTGAGGLFGGGAGAATIDAGLDSAAAALPAIWIVCTELMLQGRMPKRHWVVGAPVFAAYPQAVKDGYYLWAVPLVRHLRRKPNSLLSKATEKVFRWRAENIAAHKGVKGARKLLRGAAVTAVLYPICKTLGHIVGPQDWAAVYRNEEVAR
jgi:hypothetical protein